MPEFILLKASAGSGKTYRLAERFLSFLLKSPPDPSVRQDLANILAITFTKNAAREMKERILAWLKECSLGDAVRVRELSAKLGISPETLPGLAEAAIERILAGYTEFQVTTIDSFVSTVFKASAVDLGTSPDFEVVLDPAELIDYAFSRFLRTVVPRSPAGRDFERILDDLVRYQKRGAGFLWNPAPEVRAKLAAFYGKLTARPGDVAIGRHDKARARVHQELVSAVDDLEAEIAASGLARNARSQYWSKDVAAAVRAGRTSDLVGLTLKTPPVKKPAGRGSDAAYGRIEAGMERLRDGLGRYGAIYARDFFTPYLEIYREFCRTLETAQRRRGVVFLQDMTRRLADYLGQGIVPDVYLRLGDRIFHFLIDEFQDTSPVQWADLRPLIEESLSRGGSLFCVGDTKQAIYGFREADYEIMRNLELGRDVFGPAEAVVQELTTNWRCRREILDFAKRTFLQLGAGKASVAAVRIPAAPDGILEKYARYAELSGLDDFAQEVRPDFGEPGFVEYTRYEREKREEEEREDEGENGDTPSQADDRPEKKKIQDLVADLVGRGYAYEDIAVLTYKNETVVQVASWLNEKKIPFIPSSSLDIRLRPVVREVLAFLRFLDSPPDDLSFAAFLLGDVFRSRIGRDRAAIAAAARDAAVPDEPAYSFRDFLFHCRRRNVAPLYPAFRERFPILWDRYFEPAFRSVGYYPLYDLVTLLYRLFGVFDLFPDEEAALARLLEAVKDFEGRGRNDILEFLAMSASEAESEAWTIDVPREIPAVRIMSIHKAKGLGFPVVILLLYGQDRLPPDFYLHEAGPKIRVYKITAPLAEGDPVLKKVYDDQKAKDWVGLLNMLYVGCTRARAELYVVGVRGARAYPFDLIEAGLSGGAAEGEAPERTVFRSDATGPGAALRETTGVASPKADRLRRPGMFIPPPNTRESLNYGRVRRGEIAHRILALVESVEPGGWEAAVAAAITRLVPAAPEAELFAEVGRAIAAAFEGSPLGELFLFRPGRRVFREFDFCDKAGRVFRMDRVVADAEAVTVVDFKTGGEPGVRPQADVLETDRAQVREYAAILRDVYPGRPVRAVLSFIDSRSWEDVG